MTQKCLQMEMWSFMIQVGDGFKVISDNRMEFDNSKVFEDPKGNFKRKYGL